MVESLPLPGPSPLTSRHLAVHRFGRGAARPKVWLQAALHADELPGALVLHHLAARLAEIDGAGGIPGEIVVVPFANPIGLAQHVGGRLLGRYALDGAGNFNRGFVELRDKLADADAVGAGLGADAAANVTAVRAALAKLLDAEPPAEEAEVLKWTLQRMACDADIVLDLHCDDQAAMHLYCGPRQVEAFAPLAARLGAVALLTAEDSGDAPFDEALTRPWWRLAERFPAAALPVDACLGCTVELRGGVDIDDDMAARDAEAILDWLRDRGAVAGAARAAPAPRCAPTPLDGVDAVRAAAAGLWIPRVPPGARVAAGEVVGEIVDPTRPPGGARAALAAAVDGVLFARMSPGLVKPGDRVAKIAGASAIPGRRGKLLGD
ncbi:MAG: succinylglutamate desuccinylase/aspartoacylase family protein [Rhodospirillales bacterium]|nr:MAG: succinylglutamate desuccinylase/aspartoacylase family protein [Rhodospirillales bacterium]